MDSCRGNMAVWEVASGKERRGWTTISEAQDQSAAVGKHILYPREQFQRGWVS